MHAAKENIAAKLLSAPFFRPFFCVLCRHFGVLRCLLLLRIPSSGQNSSQSEVEFFRLMDYEIRRGAQFLALSEGQYILKTRRVNAVR